MRTRLPLLCSLLALCLAMTAPAARAGTFRTGFADPLFTSGDPAIRAEWSGHAATDGASIVRIVVPWRLVAPTSPKADFQPTEPGDPAYNWTTIDRGVRSAVAAGLEVMFEVTGAPTWAEGANRPAGTPAGTWKPVAADFGAFALALATRYDGGYADPLDPAMALPRVNLFEVWNEPNLSNYLNPQYEGTVQASAGIYRELLNSFYAAAKKAQPEATIIAGSLAPFGDPPGGERTPPVTFLRELLCLHGGRLTPVHCARPARLDVLSDHPIAVGSPADSATSPLDVTTPDLARLTKVLRKAEATKRVQPAGRKPIWVTEFWYDSNPPDPDGVALGLQARWYAQDLYSFWKQGAQVAVALQIRDSPEGSNYAATNQSGIYFVDGSPKPSAKVFRFPFVARRTGAFKVEAWGIAPRPGQVSIQAYRAGKWHTLGRTRAQGPGHPFHAEVQLLRFARLRAVIGGEASLPWSQR